MTYESTVCSENEEFPLNDKPVWILGKKYFTRTDLDALEADARTRLWFTYRRNFPHIGGTGPTSDHGWGCMLRCGQMVLGQALVNRHLGRDWIWNSSLSNMTHKRILKLFEDRKSSPYSIHQIALMGVSEGKAVGQWFGPNTVAQVLRKLVVYDDWSSLVIQVAMDNTVVINDIKTRCTTNVNGILNDDCPPLLSPSRMSGTWRPLLLFIPLRVGLSELNTLYSNSIKTCFTFKQSLGLIGGKPNHASYFIGFTGNDLVYLDPHTTQQFACSCQKSECKGTDDDSTFHCKRTSRMDISMLDPSIALCFYCDSEKDFDELCVSVQRFLIDREKQPLFELAKDCPKHWLMQESNQNFDENSACAKAYMTPDRKFDTSDDEFELL